MSSCLNTGAGRTYGFDLDIVKSSCPSIIRSSHSSSSSSSPSSTLSESNNSPPLTISTRKPRTPRKRPNQNYTEAAALLSTVYPNIFSTKKLTKFCKHAKSNGPFPEPSELLLPSLPSSFDSAGFLLTQPIPESPTSRIEPKCAISAEKLCPSSAFVDDFQLKSSSSQLFDGYEGDFDAESILDEEIEGGIDSIIGNLSVTNDSCEESKPQASAHCWNRMGLRFGGKFEFGFGFGGNVRALRGVEDGGWWRNLIVEVSDITPPKLEAGKQKKKTKKKKKKVEEDDGLGDFGSLGEKMRSGLGLKLNYEEVLNAWSHQGSPFSRKIPKQRLA